MKSHVSYLIELFLVVTIVGIPIVVSIHLSSNRKYSDIIVEYGEIPVRLDEELRKLRHDNMELHHRCIEYERKNLENETHSKTLDGRLLETMKTHPEKWVMTEIYGYVNLNFDNKIKVSLERGSKIPMYWIISPSVRQMTLPKETIEKAILALKNKKIEIELEKATLTREIK